MLLYDARISYQGAEATPLGKLSPDTALQLSTELGEGCRIYLYEKENLIRVCWDGAIWDK